MKLVLTGSVLYTMKISALVSLAAAFSTSMISAGHATPISYMVDPGSTTVLNGDTEAITGTFTFDAATDTESAVDFTLTGPSPYAGTYIDTALDISELQSDGNDNIVCGDSASHTACLNFFNSLGADATDILHIVGYGPPGPNSAAQALDGAPVASASPITAVAAPEPSSLALLGGALAGVISIRRRANRA